MVRATAQIPLKFNTNSTFQKHTISLNAVIPWHLRRGKWSMRNLDIVNKDKTFFSFSVNLITHWIGQHTSKDRKFLKVHWSDFHLSPLGGIVISFPVIPVDTISVRFVRAMMIQAIQVGVMTALVPPGSFKLHRTVTARAVIFGCKGVPTMTRKRIPGSSWKQKNKNLILYDAGLT